MIQVEKPPLTFDELMSTTIEFLAFAMNRLKLNKITRADLVGPVFNLLKGHKSPVDMSKPLPLQDKEGRLTNSVELFFNNDLEYLKAGNKDRMYSSSTTNTPAAWVKDVQLGVESYQTKLNLTNTRRSCQHLSVKESYTPNYDPPRIIYEDKLLNFKFGYNKGMPLWEWIGKDKRRTDIMVNKIDDLLFKRRVMRSLEVLIMKMEEVEILEDNGDDSKVDVCVKRFECRGNSPLPDLASAFWNGSAGLSSDRMCFTITYTSSTLL
nr:hypothetical protein [Tanacetum cinerariifolium]